ncbi:hypothetical protein PsorP6_015562 [Peronosclerospora sorghi]|uniref:Uncharacterized protein n=1 Tax=Peronosclerospora sorghi TaxID=230839 RepID=A0ACC0WPT7_9STRA|nr:hypothetical protein PsorP6_015562 [Peronosclerospora sorghi]
MGQQDLEIFREHARITFRRGRGRVRKALDTRRVGMDGRTRRVVRAESAVAALKARATVACAGRTHLFIRWIARGRDIVDRGKRRGQRDGRHASDEEEHEHHKTTRTLQGLVVYHVERVKCGREEGKRGMISEMRWAGLIVPTPVVDYAVRKVINYPRKPFLPWNWNWNRREEEKKKTLSSVLLTRTLPWMPGQRATNGFV